MRKGYINFNNSFDIIEIIIRDGTKRKKDFFRFNLIDEKAHQEVAKTIFNKYGLNLGLKDVTDKEIFDF